MTNDNTQPEIQRNARPVAGRRARTQKRRRRIYHRFDFRRRCRLRSRLLAAAPDLLAALESLVETFDPDRQVIYSFARGKIEAAKHAIEYIYQSNRQ